jgi:hypothetical protein
MLYSDYFRAMFVTPMKETRENVFRLGEANGDAVRLKFCSLLTGELSLNNVTVAQVLDSSDRLMVQGAKDLCGRS